MQRGDFLAQTCHGLFVILYRAAQFLRIGLMFGKCFRVPGLKRGDFRVVFAARLVEQRHRRIEVFLNAATFIREGGVRGFGFVDLPVEVGHERRVAGDRFLEIPGGNALAFELRFVRGAEVGNLLFVFRLRLLQSGIGIVDLSLQRSAFAGGRVERRFQSRDFDVQSGNQFFLRGQLLRDRARGGFVRGEQRGFFRTGGFDLLLKIGALGGRGVERLLQPGDLAAGLGQRGVTRFFQSGPFGGEAFGLFFGTGLDRFKFGEKFFPIRLQTIAVGREFFHLLAEFRRDGAAGFRAALRGGELFAAFGERLPGLVEILEDRDFFLLDLRRFRAEFLDRTGAFGVRLFQLLRRAVARVSQLLDLRFRRCTSGIAFAEQRFDPVAVFRNVFLEARDGPRFPLRTFGGIGARGGFDRLDGGHRFPAHFFDLLDPLVTLGDRLAIRLGQRLDPLLQIFLRAGKFRFAFARGGIGFALRLRAHRLDQRGGFLARAIGGGEGALGLDPRLALARQLLCGRALAAFKRRDALLQFLEMPLIFLPRQIAFHDGFLLRGEARGRLCELVGQLRLELQQGVPLVLDRRDFFRAAFLVGAEFCGERFEMAGSISESLLQRVAFGGRRSKFLGRFIGETFLCFDFPDFRREFFASAGELGADAVALFGDRGKFLPATLAYFLQFLPDGIQLRRLRGDFALQGVAFGGELRRVFRALRTHALVKFDLLVFLGEFPAEIREVREQGVPLLERRAGSLRAAIFQGRDFRGERGQLRVLGGDFLLKCVALGDRPGAFLRLLPVALFVLLDL